MGYLTPVQASGGRDISKTPKAENATAKPIHWAGRIAAWWMSVWPVVQAIWAYRHVPHSAAGVQTVRATKHRAAMPVCPDSMRYSTRPVKTAHTNPPIAAPCRMQSLADMRGRYNGTVRDARGAE